MLGISYKSYYRLKYNHNNDIPSEKKKRLANYREILDLLMINRKSKKKLVYITIGNFAFGVYNSYLYDHKKRKQSLIHYSFTGNSEVTNLQ